MINIQNKGLSLAEHITINTFIYIYKNLVRISGNHTNIWTYVYKYISV